MNLCEVCGNKKSKKYHTYEVRDKTNNDVAQRLNICDDCAREIYGYDIPFTHPNIRLMCQAQILDFMKLKKEAEAWQKGQISEEVVYNSNNHWAVPGNEQPMQKVLKPTKNPGRYEEER